MKLIRNLPAAEYHAAPGVSCSMLANMDPPARLPVYLKERQEPTPWAIMGTLVHQRLLEPNAPLPALAVPPDTYPSKDGPKPWTYAAKYCKEWKAEQEASGKTVLTSAELDIIIGCVDAVRANPLASQALANGESELSFFCDVDDLKGRRSPTKSRYDFVPFGSSLVDVKTTINRAASPREWQKTVIQRRYHVQAAAYLRRWNAQKADKTHWLWIVVEKAPPYLVGTYMASDRLLELGWQTYLRDLTMYNDCIEAGQWPGYSNRWEPLDPPAWVE